MSATPADTATLATTPPQEAISSRVTSPSGIIRSRDEFDDDTDESNGSASSPHPPKIARKSLDAEDIAQAGPADTAKEGEFQVLDFAPPPPSSTAQPMLTTR